MVVGTQQIVDVGLVISYSLLAKRLVMLLQVSVQLPLIELLPIISLAVTLAEGLIIEDNITRHDCLLTCFN